ncbi:MAG: tRNA preQ1(34) S-adenosylmethionine ribosyltransferase-isomerase QueA, partial [Coriobacteriia bacterium]|nr:tRNA preQ1(34) S-adenosylmethionine ribosyltransferase-isomerase QueA [Coriobacteriia bacterium]
MLTSEFDYKLPHDRIAQNPAIPRDSCRLLVLDRKRESIEHRVFSDIIEYLTEADLLVVNTTKVMPARLIGKRVGGGEAEVLLLRRIRTISAYDELWEALVRPGRRLRPGSLVLFPDMTAEIIDWTTSGERGGRIVQLFTDHTLTIDESLHKNGELPLPPYITNYTGDRSQYQTVYAQKEDSAAAPTAGLHFTPELLDRIRERGVRLANVDLSVGLDTFRPVDEERIEDHRIHSERYSVNASVLAAIEDTRRKEGRVIAVGTTSVRSLESCWDTEEGMLVPRADTTTSLFIMPGYQFRAVDALITNFHAPRSTLLALVSAFASHELIMKAYNEALSDGYRLLSFGDA